jgi:aldehyde:ferredoxin oxidoreductase
MKVGERAINLARVFNSREGFTRADDSLPDRFFEPLMGEGPLSGYSLDRKVFEEALDFYYAMMGWNQIKACPTQAKLIELDVDWAAEHLP